MNNAGEAIQASSPASSPGVPPGVRADGEDAAATRSRDGCAPRFMESHLDFDAVHWDHDPVRIPLNRTPGTFSPTGGEGWDEG